MSEELTMKIWTCKIGEVSPGVLPAGADNPMRGAITKAYLDLTGQDADFIFSGWGGELTEPEWAVVENREPSAENYKQWCDTRADEARIAALEAEVARLEDKNERIGSPDLSDFEVETALTSEGIFCWGPDGERFERMFSVVMKARAAGEEGRK